MKFLPLQNTDQPPSRRPAAPQAFREPFHHLFPNQEKNHRTSQIAGQFHQLQFPARKRNESRAFRMKCPLRQTLRLREKQALSFPEEIYPNLRSTLNLKPSTQYSALLKAQMEPRQAKSDPDQAESLPSSCCRQKPNGLSAHKKSKARIPEQHSRKVPPPSRKQA